MTRSVAAMMSASVRCILTGGRCSIICFVSCELREMSSSRGMAGEFIEAMTKRKKLGRSCRSTEPVTPLELKREKADCTAVICSWRCCSAGTEPWQPSIWCDYTPSSEAKATSNCSCRWYNEHPLWEVMGERRVAS